MALRYWAIRGDVVQFTSAVYTGAFCGRVSPTGATETWSMRRPCRTKSWLEDSWRIGSRSLRSRWRPRCQSCAPWPATR